MKCIEMSNFRGIKQRDVYFCTFACIEMCLIYLNERNISQEDIKNSFTPFFEDNVPMFQTYEDYFTQIFPDFQAVRFNNSEVNELIKYIKHNVNNKYPVIQSILSSQGESHAIVILCYDNEKFIYHDPGPNKPSFIRISEYEAFLGGYRGTLVIKKFN